jgi:hypothetical protein
MKPNQTHQHSQLRLVTPSNGKSRLKIYAQLHLYRKNRPGAGLTALSRDAATAVHSRLFRVIQGYSGLFKVNRTNKFADQRSQGGVALEENKHKISYMAVNDADMKNMAKGQSH